MSPEGLSSSLEVPSNAEPMASETITSESGSEPNSSGGRNEANSWISWLTLHWLSPLLSVGFTRPLLRDDLWLLPRKRQSEVLALQLQERYYDRVPPENRPHFLKGTPPPPANHDTVEENSRDKGFTQRFRTARDTREHKYDSSLVWAIHWTFFARWWFAGILKLIADMLETVIPLVNKLLLTFLTTTFFAAHSPGSGVAAPHGIGYGIGLAFAIFVMQESASLFTNHSTYLSMKTGMMVQSGIISLIFRKSLRLSPRSRITHSPGQITTMISTDAARLELAAWLVHSLWIAPIQLIVGIALLIVQLGYSALVAVGVLVLSFPLQGWLVTIIFKQRLKGVKFTDERVRLTSEILQGIRLIKAYTWERFFTSRVQAIRSKELRTVRVFEVARAALIAIMTATPTIAAVLAFITYSLTNHELTAPVIFTALQFMNIVRLPMIYLPFAISTSSDAVVALKRIGKFLLAEERQEPYRIDLESKWAVKTDGAAFQWEDTQSSEEANKLAADKTDEKGTKGVKAEPKNDTEQSKNSGDAVEVVDEKSSSFSLAPLTLHIPRGAFVAIVGRIGSGKSSLLSALTGEMRRTTPDLTITLGGTVAYVPQTPWIQNATLLDNILFGSELDEARYDAVVRACALQKDLEMLPAGRNTEIGEKGVTLSGGQKSRIALARAAYRAVSDSADILLLDDILSAVDAHVGKHIVDKCLINGPMAGKTRVLVTHALGILQKTDYVYCLDSGRIIEEGTYQELSQSNGELARLLKEYGSQEQAEGEKAPGTAAEDESAGKPDLEAADALMQDEERNTGAVAGIVYGRYLKAGGGLSWAPLILVILTLYQASQVGNNLFLGYWTGRLIPGFSNGQYMAVYAGLGVSTAMFSFLGSFAFSLIGLVASFRLFRGALWSVVRSPVAFFDTTPMGRIVSRLSKDMDTLDTLVSATIYQVMSSLSGVLGTVALVFYTFPLLGIIFAPMIIIYYVVSTFYRRSSVEVKRLDSNLRSGLYASYTETLTGLSTVRAYSEEARFVKDAEQALDMQNRAYFLTVALQRWLGLRLDLLGNLLVLGIALFAVGFRESVNPSKIGVVLTYTLASEHNHYSVDVTSEILSVAQQLSEIVTLYAEAEQNFNAVERVLTYNDLKDEGKIVTDKDPHPSWPARGEIRFDNVDLSYREGLPLVLKDVSFNMKAGEKVGVVGRTGAGKSSILQALFRMVNVTRGTIKIDDIETSNIGLQVLRAKLAFVPQDSTLFAGPLRDNLDPERTATDVEVIDALRQVSLIPQEGESSSPSSASKFALDAEVAAEGSNYSVGERQLLALVRAIIKRTRIIVLDEATSSIDLEADSRLQTMIQTKFRDVTLLCIAHRLNTIVYYDRVLVMDAGKVAEYDTPLQLFDRQDSIFRSLCNEAQLTRADIVRIRTQALKESEVPP